MVVIKTSSCFSVRWFLRTSSVPTGAVADLCNELSKGVGASGKPDAPDHVEKMEISTDISIAENPTNAQHRRNLVQEHDRKFQQLSEDQNLSKGMFWCGFEACRRRTILLYSWYRRRAGDATFMPRIHNASKREEDSCKRMDSQEHENRPSLGHLSLSSWRPKHYWSSGQISVSRQNRFLG